MALLLENFRENLEETVVKKAKSRVKKNNILH